MDISKDREPNQNTLLILCIYFLGLPLIEILQEQYKDLSTEAMSVHGKWIQKYKPRKISSKRKKINEFIIDETQLLFIIRIIPVPFRWTTDDRFKLIKRYTEFLCKDLFVTVTL